MTIERHFLKKCLKSRIVNPHLKKKSKSKITRKLFSKASNFPSKKSVPKEIAGLLVDEEFGSAVLREAKKNGLTFAMPVEKSGQEEFDFEYGENYAKHIEEFDPTFVKVLVRYNPESDATLNKRQLQRLKKLSDYLAQKKETLPL